MGFSLLGLAVSLAIFLPNLLLIPFPPRPKLEGPAVPRVLLVFERAGQALCMTVPVLIRPLLRQLSLVSAVTVGVIVVVFGGAAFLLFVLPILTTVFIALGALTAVILLHRAERHVAAAAMH